jgi:alkanesulfonate monooxygenase SsuD/methylene tetrahydromethanopterin reductase-like flavin-dependent oxidoreductase (luciferase family)
MANLRLSFISPAPQVNAEFFLQVARRSEEIGLHSLWINDRLVYDNFEPLSTLAAAAGATRTIGLGTAVLLLPYRNPVLLAKTLAMIDFISHGRLTLGVGIGNRVSDSDAVRVPFDQRGARGLESIQLMRQLWREDSVSFAGKFFQVRIASRCLSIARGFLPDRWKICHC